MFTFWLTFPSMKNITTHLLPLQIKVFAKLSSQARSLFKTDSSKVLKYV